MKFKLVVASLIVAISSGVATAEELWTSLPSPHAIQFESGYVTPVGYQYSGIDCHAANHGCIDTACTSCGCDGGAIGGSECGSCVCDPCASRIDHSGTWVTMDYLLWQVSGYGVPALVTSSPPGTPRTDAGVLPAATVLFGNDELDDDLRSGGRLRFGYWYDDWRTYGFEGSFLALGQESSNFTAQGDGSTGSIGRPFFNEDPSVNAQDALIIAFDEPGPADAFAGSTSVTTSSNVYSGHFAFRQLLQQCGNHRVDLTLGYRFFRLNEGLQINDNITVDGVAGGIVGTNFLIEDQFETSNAFHGAEIGLVSMNNYGCWSTELIMKLALGNNHKEVQINGSTTTTLPGFAPIVTQQGLLTQSTNIGNYRSDRFTVIPEINANLAYQVTEAWKLTAGYSLIYVSDVTRPGDALDYNVNGTLLAGPFAGPASPAFDFDSDSLWVYGLNFGAQYNY